MHFPAKFPAFVSILVLFYSLTAAQQTNYKPVPNSAIKLDTAYKFVTACIITEKQLTKGNLLILAGLTDEKDCETSFTHYAVYIGDPEGKPTKYLGEEAARQGRFDFSSVYLADTGENFAVVEQGGDSETGTSRTRYTFSLDPKDTSKDLRREYTPAGVSTFYHNDTGLYFVGTRRDDALIGRIELGKVKVGPITILENRAGTNLLKDIVEISNDEKAGFAVKMETGKYIFSGKDWEFVEANIEQPVSEQSAELRLNSNSAIDTTIFSTATPTTAKQPEPQKDFSVSPKVAQVTNEAITVNWKGESRTYNLPPLSKEAVEKNLQITDCDPVHNIGPYAVYGDSVVFGIQIYSGESACGVGGLGFFNPYDGKYTFRYYKEIAPYSSTALLIDGNTAYVGLTSEGEYSSSPEGLATIDLATGNIKILKIPYRISTLFMHDGILFAGTDDGLSIIYPTGLVSQLKLDLDKDGNCLHSLSAPKRIQ